MKQQEISFMASYDMVDANLRKAKALADLLESCDPAALRDDTLVNAGVMLTDLLTVIHSVLDAAHETERQRKHAGYTPMKSPNQPEK